MDITDLRKNNVLILALRGKLDSITSPALQEKILNFIQEGNSRIVIDCRALDYLSSSGIRVFFIAGRNLKACEGKLVFAAPTPQVKKVIDIVGMSQYFSVFAGLEEAVQSLA
ncbi:MAG: STAS domain-containing protein [bacterium]